MVIISVRQHFPGASRCITGDTSVPEHTDLIKSNLCQLTLKPLVGGKQQTLRFHSVTAGSSNSHSVFFFSIYLSAKETLKPSLFGCIFEKRNFKSFQRSRNYYFFPFLRGEI